MLTAQTEGILANFWVHGTRRGGSEVMTELTWHWMPEKTWRPLKHFGESAANMTWFDIPSTAGLAMHSLFLRFLRVGLTAVRGPF